MKPVVIIGGGITGLAAAWELQQRGCDYILLEASGRLGGKIKTERVDGFIIEGAADSFLSTKPAAWQLCREVGLGDRLIGTNDARRNVYVLRDGKLQLFPKGMQLLVPTDPDGLLASDLLTDEGKRRMLAETEIPPRTATGDESLGDFVRRRFGQEALDVFGEPLLAGIYTGDPETLSMQATFPNYLTLEQQYGSVTSGTRQAKPATATLPNAPKTAFVSLRNGMFEMIEGISAALTGEVRLNSPVSSLEPGLKVRLANRETIEASAIIVTAPAHTSGKLLATLAPEITEGLQTIKTISSATVTFGFKERELPAPLDGFGFVVAATEPTHLLASTWSSTKLPGRAPEGYALLRVFLGGHRCQEDAFLPDDQMVALARAELKKVMHIEAEPVITRIFRWIDANTQYQVGHLERIAQLQRQSPPGLFLTGSPYGGVGIPDCVRQGRETVQQVIPYL
jgi:oxygen-dependent protoporphyrinogen oxidase